MQEITVSIMPTFACKTGCDYCYLGKQTETFECASLRMIRHRLLQIRNTEKYKIIGIELYGGNLNLLSESYLEELRDLCYEFSPKVYYTGVPTHKTDLFDACNISVNKERPDYETNLKLAHEKDLSVITVALNDTMDMDVKELLGSYNGLTNYVTFMPFSESVSNREYPQKVNNNSYDEFLKKVVAEYVTNKDKYTFKLSNLEIIDDAIEGHYTPLMNNNIFITPAGNFAHVEYVGTKEYFRDVTLKQWETRCAADEEMYAHYCAGCTQYKCGCIADHVKSMTGCNGCRRTVQWVKEWILVHGKTW